MIYQYDINSAYAAIYRRLPCLLHGTWQRLSSLPQKGLYLADVTFKHDNDFRHWCTLPIRTHTGVLAFPREGRGMYWSVEINVARNYGVELEFHDGYQYHTECVCVPIDFVDGMYHERLKLGKDAKGMVLKLVLASIYGKLAQSIGCAPFSNPVWAGLITAYTRSQLIDASLSVNLGRDVVMLATDGLFTRQPIPHLPIGRALGQWTLTEHPNIFIVQSGVYFLPNTTPKTRGVPQSRIIQHEQLFRDAWRNWGTNPTGHPATVTIELRNFIGLRLALARHKLNTAGQWLTTTKDIGFDWTTKRQQPQLVGTKLVTKPLDGSPNLLSEPYNRTIGGTTVRLAAEFEAQPDWGDQL